MNHFDMPITDPQLAGVDDENEPTIAVRCFALLDGDGTTETIVVSTTPLTQVQFQGMLEQVWQKCLYIAQNLGNEHIDGVTEREVEVFVQDGLTGLLCYMFPDFGFTRLSFTTAHFT